jgi:hypothetical protein
MSMMLMTKTRLFSGVLAAAVWVTGAWGADAPTSPKPGMHQAILEKMEGSWDTTMNMGGTESKGRATYKMDLGGLWLASTYEGVVAGQKFTGRGFDTYDEHKGKYVAV